MESIFAIRFLFCTFVYFSIQSIRNWGRFQANCLNREQVNILSMFLTNPLLEKKFQYRPKHSKPSNLKLELAFTYTQK